MPSDECPLCAIHCADASNGEGGPHVVIPLAQSSLTQAGQWCPTYWFQNSFSNSLLLSWEIHYQGTKLTGSLHSWLKVFTVQRNLTYSMNYYFVFPTEKILDKVSQFIAPLRRPYISSFFPGQSRKQQQTQTNLDQLETDTSITDRLFSCGEHLYVLPYHASLSLTSWHFWMTTDITQSRQLALGQTAENACS